MNAMMRSTVALSLIAFVVSTSAQAQDKQGTNRAPIQVASIDPNGADALALGYRLADHARTTRDARAMIVAAKIIDSIPVKSGDDPGTITRADGTPAGTPTGAVGVKTMAAADLFAEARTFAAGDRQLLAAVRAAQAQASKGCVCGAIRTVQYVPAQRTWTIRLSWRGGDPMVVAARRDSATPMSLKVHDENGNLVCQDRSGNATMYCRVNPIWTGPFAITMTNHGQVGTGVAFVTN